MIIVGIDPGRKGAVAILYSTPTSWNISAYEMPYVARDIDVPRLCGLLNGWLDEMEVWIERVHSMPGQGVASTFAFGVGFGVILGVIQAMELPMHLVAPQTWKAEILRDTDKSKEAAIEHVMQTYPGVDLLQGRRKPHDGMADAICIAEYGLRKRGKHE